MSPTRLGLGDIIGLRVNSREDKIRCNPVRTIVQIHCVYYIEFNKGLKITKGEGFRENDSFIRTGK